MKALAVTVFLLAALLSAMLVAPVYQLQQRYQQESIGHLSLLPAPAIHALDLEFDGVTADYLLLKTISYIGYKLLEKQHLTTDEWRTVVRMLNLTTDLDPRFWDPYLLGEMMLPWDAGMIDEANQLLKKAAHNRPEDFRPWYFLGFNAFFFEKNAAKAAPFLRRAAGLPGAPSFLKGLASRFSYYADQTAMGIAFLKNMLSVTRDQTLHANLEKRLAVLLTMQDLGKAVQRFRKEYDRVPSSLEELRDQGYIKKIPTDPYGGKFVILKNGRVYTTSNLVPVKKQ